MITLTFAFNSEYQPLDTIVYWMSWWLLIGLIPTVFPIKMDVMWEFSHFVPTFPQRYCTINRILHITWWTQDLISLKPLILLSVR